jgi:hypothetical protein
MNSSLPLAAFVALLFICTGWAAAAPASPAAAWLAGQLAAQDNILWVYRDYADGLNQFNQRVWFGDNGIGIPAMDEAAAGHSGISGIAAELDLSQHAWGGYMFVNGVSPVDNADAGLNLSGAEKLVFYARGENGGERVEFFIGGLGWNEWENKISTKYPDSAKVSLGFVTLGKEWQKFDLPLAGKDLRRIACGLAWVTNNRQNPSSRRVRFYLDDIHYEWARPRPQPLFLPSYAAVKPGSDGAVINNFAYLYDNAAAALALSCAGEHERARQIADAIVYVYGHDRTFTDGRLRNVYATGNPAGLPYSRLAKDTDFARLPGFYDEKERAWREDYYAVSTSAGNLAWAMLALCQVAKHAPEPAKYIQTAKGIGDFVLTFRDEKGGFTGGYEGWEGQQKKATYKSTEHNIDLIAAYARLAVLTGEAKYADASRHAKAFVLSMYDASRGCFYTGATADGVTVNKEVLPLDTNTWAILVLRGDCPNAAKTLAFIEANMALGGGYGFNGDRDGVWFEGTAQAALAYKQAGNLEKYRQILQFLNKNAEETGAITAADRDGVSSGFMVSGTNIPWRYGKRTHTGATAWLAFAQLGVNPFWDD